MKKVIAVLTLFVLPFIANAQILDPVKWDFSAKKINANTYELHMKANMEAGWHVYAQDCGEGPIPTTFTLTNNPLVKLVGKVKENGKLQKTFDKNYKTEMKYYENHADFVQTVTLKGKGTTKVKGKVEFMACDDHQCLPGKEVTFAIVVGR
ncbi:protein-disulfide reductase DsbD domain-containing protein [Chitinophaga sp. Hz27]|uniref:protein-disulfide reductase DsbD domain-containing protein n=1 Tax=Chitinophaga sp. Hz27 TaxID=3347169 RepID=UPI0035DAE663